MTVGIQQPPRLGGLPQAGAPAAGGIVRPPVSPLPAAAPMGPPPPRPVSPVGGLKFLPNGVKTTYAPGQAPAGATNLGSAGQSAPPVSPVGPSASSAPAGSSTSSFGTGNDLLSTQINPMTGGPNRTQLAQNSIASWEAQNAPALATEQRTIGQNAAKFGRIGAGMTTNDLTGSQATYDRNRMDFQNQLASGLANGTIADQQNANDQLRTERAYQTNRNDKATQDAIDQQQLQDQLQNSSFGRALDTAKFGYGGSPVDTLGNFSNALGNSGAAATGAGINLMTGANKQPAPIDWSSILQNMGGAKAPTPAALPGTASPIIGRV